MTDPLPDDDGTTDAVDDAVSSAAMKYQANGRSDPPLPNTVAARRAGAADGGLGIARMLHAKLWENPCWLAFRMNYLALRYNTPLYGWVGRTRGLSRVEYVVIYSLGLADGAQARDISESSGFPKNTLSRAIAKLEKRGHIVREHQPGGGRNQPLRLSKSGHALFDETLPVFERFETMMLAALTPPEQETLAALLAKVVLAADTWPETLIDPDRDL
jgi:DNA-binding MarR family transcriptional regulator